MDSRHIERSIAVTLLRDLMRRRSAAEEMRAAESVIDEAMADPNGRLANDLRKLGLLPPKEEPK